MSSGPVVADKTAFSDPSETAPGSRSLARASRASLLQRLVVLTDLVSLTAAGLVAAAFRSDDLSSLGASALIAGLLVAWTVVGRLQRRGRRESASRIGSTVDEFPSVLQLAIVVSWVLLTGAWLAEHGEASLTMIVVLTPLAPTFVLVGRSILRTVVARVPSFRQRVLVLGAGTVGQLIATKIRITRSEGLDVVGFVDAEPLALDEGLADLPVWRNPDELGELIEQLAIDRVIVAYSKLSHAETLRLLDLALRERAEVDVIPRFYEFLGPGARMDTFEGMAVMRWPGPGFSPRSLALKRLEDVLVAGLTLLFLAPALIVIAVAVKLDSPGPVFFRHERVGRGGKPFQLLKFRTFKNEYSGGGDAAQVRLAELLRQEHHAKEFERSHKLKNDPRVTRIGSLLRQLSMDELPQLINVLRGELSLVGPRPVTRTELERYGESAAILLSIMPGVTGYWQINGRSDVSYRERIRLDMTYVNNWSLGLDVSIMLKTLKALVARNAY